MNNIRALEQRFSELFRKPNKSDEDKQQLEIASAAFFGRLLLEELGLIEELRSTGLNISSVWDLVNTRKKYPPEVVPILVRHLSENYHEKNMEGIVRALAVKEAKGKANPGYLLYTPNSPWKKRVSGGLSVTRSI